MTINIGAGQVKQAVSTNFQDAPLGSIGNLTFAGKPGATPRAPSPNILQRIGLKLEAAIAYVKASPQERASQQVVAGAKKISAGTGAVLGALTGASGDRVAQGKAASALADLLKDAAPLATAGQSGTAQMIAPALNRHLDKLSTSDLVALRGGPLADPASRAAIVAQLDPAQRSAAQAVLDQVGGALDKQIGVRASEKPIAAIAAKFASASSSNTPVDTQAMDAALEQLHAGAGMLKRDGQTLRHFFAPAVERLTDAELRDIASGLSRSTPQDRSSFDAMREGVLTRAPNGVVGGSRKDALDALQGAAADEINKRLNTAAIVASTSLDAELRDTRVPVALKAVDRLQSNLGAKVSELGAQHLVPADGANATAGLLGRALANLPERSLDRLLAGVDSDGVITANAATATLPDPAQTLVRAAIANARDTQLERLQARVDTARDRLAVAVTKGDQGDIGDKTKDFARAVGKQAEFNAAFALPVDAAVKTALDAEVTVACDNHAARLMMAVDVKRDELAVVTASGDRGQIVMKLKELGSAGGAIQQLNEFESSVGRPVGIAHAAALSTSIGAAVNVLRAADNPAGPLGQSSLKGLDNHEFGMVRSARGELGNYGLRFDSPAVAAELTARTAASNARADAAAAELLQSLADPRASAADQLRQVRELASHTGTTLSTLTTLGEIVGADDIARVSGVVTRGAVAAYRTAQGDAADAQVSTILSRYEQHLAPLAQALPTITMKVADMASEDQADQASNAAKQTTGLLTTGSCLLKALQQDLGSSLPQAPAASAARVAGLSKDVRTALEGEFGLRVDAGATTIAPAMSPEQRSQVEAALVQTPPGAGQTEITLAVGGRSDTFQVDSTFAKDAVERTGVSFAVSGRDADGNQVHSSALRPGLQGDARPAALGEGLSALQRLAGPAAMPLTRYMNQQLAAGLISTLALTGADGPVRLPSGEAVSPGGAGRLHFDIERLPDGRLSASVTIAFSGLASGVAMSPSTIQPVGFDPEKSTFEAQFSVYVSDDGSTFTMRDPLHVRHTLVQVPLPVH